VFMPFTLPILPVVLSFALGGCATELTLRRREALDAFIGARRSTVIDQLGTPTRSYTQNGDEMLAYDFRRASPSPLGNSTDCTTTFRLADGQVDAWLLDGDDCRNVAFPPGGVDDPGPALRRDDGDVLLWHGLGDLTAVNKGEFQTR